MGDAFVRENGDDADKSCVSATASAPRVRLGAGHAGEVAKCLPSVQTSHGGSSSGARGIRTPETDSWTLYMKSFVGWLAHNYLRRERPGHTLQTTALVYDSYLEPLQRRCHGAMSRNEEFDGSAAVAFRIMFRGATGEGRTYRFTMNRRPSFVTS